MARQQLHLEEVQAWQIVKSVQIRFVSGEAQMPLEVEQAWQIVKCVQIRFVSGVASIA